MIQKDNLLSLLQELNDELVKHDTSRELIIYGGAALISMNIVHRATVDIDVFQPRLDPVLLECIRVIGERHLLGEYWINSTGTAFVKSLPKGWEKRISHFYSGSHLKIYSLGRIDLLFTKLFAELDRQEDLQDILSLKPTREELEQVQEPLLNLENDSAWKNKVRALLESLMP